MKNVIAMSVFDLCRKEINMPLRDLLQWLDVESDYYEHIDLGDRYLRITESGFAQISEIKGDFDRWSNSQEMEFDLNRPSERRAFLRLYESRMQKSVA